MGNSWERAETIFARRLRYGSGRTQIRGDAQYVRSLAAIG
jgi:hypothetical protein